MNKRNILRTLIILALVLIIPVTAYTAKSVLSTIYDEMKQLSDSEMVSLYSKVSSEMSARHLTPAPTTKAQATAKPTQKASYAATSGSTSTSRQTKYILNTNTKKFHYPSCNSVNQMKQKNKKEFTGTAQEAKKMGYSPCGNCNPQ